MTAPAREGLMKELSAYVKASDGPSAKVKTKEVTAHRAGNLSLHYSRLGRAKVLPSSFCYTKPGE